MTLTLSITLSMLCCFLLFFVDNSPKFYSPIVFTLWVIFYIISFIQETKLKDRIAKLEEEVRKTKADGTTEEMTSDIE